ncbi:MAG TPA: DUF2726 domain-containing protein, partial [Chloroflexia bacterium]|nr:DUF2726 domain-containing protein [Chloroflexia bacterium]
MNLSWELILAALGVLAILAVGGLWLRRPAGPAPLAYPYRKRDALLTAAERSFYGVLLQAVDGTWQVFVKVRLADLLYIPGDTDGRQSAWNRIQSKHVDFVLCTPGTL